MLKLSSPIGFGHALLRTTWESETERQPYSLDGEVWITGDIRLDRRDELIDRLYASGCRFDKDVPDVDLILYAYRVWGADCVERVSGDFAFAIWDSRSQRLFCARDHYCLRLHPQVSDRLNERTIGDFLLASINLDFTTTVFADIQKLPPPAGRREVRFPDRISRSGRLYPADPRGTPGIYLSRTPIVPEPSR